MRTPAEYGDNFPVPSSGAWDPTVPWRFPTREVRLRGRSLLSLILPWVTLGLGVTLGVLWMVLRLDLASAPVGNPAAAGQGNNQLRPQGPSSWEVPSPKGLGPAEESAHQAQTRFA